MKTFSRKASYAAKGKKPNPNPSHDTKKDNWLWGTHAVTAALSNSRRTIHRRLATESARGRLGDLGRDFEDVAPHALSSELPEGAVHQGVAIKIAPLPEQNLEDILATTNRLVVLDQVQDPHNLGAIFRSAAAFGFGGVVLQSRNAPPITGVVAKAAAGAIELIPELRVVNIARTLRTLDESGWYSIGLAGDGPQPLSTAVSNLKDEKLAVVIGAEGSGLRPNVQNACSMVAHIPISQTMESLNASVAGAIAFYEMRVRAG